MISDKPITIAVIADTHISRLDELPPLVLDTLTRVDLILHLGDFTSPQLVDDLKRLGKFHGIWGNHDRLPEMRRKLRRIELLEVGGKKLALIHGLFLPVARQRMILALFKKKKIDILLFGHSHLITNKIINGVFLFNPGTVTCKFPATQGSFGLLTLNGTITSRVIPISYHFSMKQKLLMTIPAWVIREGTRFLESWPYIDFPALWRNTRIFLKRLSLSSRKYRYITNHDINHSYR